MNITNIIKNQDVDTTKEYSTLDITTSLLKRTFDIIFSIIGLTLTLPLFPILAVAIKKDSPGPVFFTQPRIGFATSKQVKIFNIIKFRTMVNDAEKISGAKWADKADIRVTPLGHFLRKTRLDEVPQFINVLKGDMSIVGPRPERPGFYDKLDQAIPFFAERTYGVLPGITGLAQVNQGYDTCINDVRSKVGFDHRYSLALKDPLSWLKMDLSILIQTVVVMIKGRGQ